MERKGCKKIGEVENKEILVCEKEKKYKCTFCGYETDNLSLGLIRVGCPKCGKKGFSKYDKKEYDAIMQHLGNDNKNVNVKERIVRLQSLIQNMKDDGELFGLVGEDIDKIRKWKEEIAVLQSQK